MAAVCKYWVVIAVVVSAVFFPLQQADAQTCTRTAYRSQRYTAYRSRSSTYDRCSWWRRCRETRYHQESYTAYRTQSYSYSICCPGYGPSLPCRDINECTSGTDRCHLHATCRNTQGSYTCSCNTGYTGNGFTCTPVNCGTLSNPVNGRVSHISGTTYRRRAYYYCNTGYYRVGSSSRTCLSTGSWSGSAPTCQPYCSTLSNPANGRVRYTGRTSGQRATYTCNTGYYRVGSSSRTCLSTGSWSGSAPTCPPYCSTLSNPANGRVRYTGRTSGQRATYTCNTGYYRVGSSSRTCLSTGSWSGSVPTCPPVNCGSLTNMIITIGQVSHTAGTTYGKTATYRCNTGYRMVGSSTRTCQATRLWSGSTPTCQDVNECTSGTARCHRYATCHNTCGSYTCSCNSGYTGSGVSCTPVNCGTLTYPARGRVSHTGGTTYGRRAYYYCSTGYYRVGSSTRTCQSTGRWSGSAPTCQDINECTSGTDRCHSHATCRNTYGSYTCSCNTGYTGNGFSCTPVNCGSLSNPANCQVSHTGGTTYGHRATYSCNTGYNRVGSSSRTCQSTGRWSGSAPTCQAVNCGTLSNPARGRVSHTGGTTFGQAATYSCNAGYDLVGSSTRTCQATRVWSGSEPTCQDVNECSRDTDSCHSYASCHNTQGSYSCSCNTGYTGNGFSCTPVNCGTPSSPANGQVSHTSGTTFGQTATYSCDTGYDLMGDNTRTCQSTGVWSGSEPTCQVVNCGTLSNPARGHVSHTGGTTFGKSATYSCNTGYNLVGSSTRACQTTRVWSGSAPTCQDANECTEGINSCHIDATCHNTRGNYTCSCNPGYTGDGFSCTVLLASAPTITTAISHFPNSINLVWTQPLGEVVDSYEIVTSYQGDCTGVTHTSTWFLYGTARQHTLTGLKEFSNYSVTMMAVNDAGKSEQSSRSFITMADAPGDSPLEVRALATSSISITIRWGHVPCINRNSNITGYIVRYSKDGGRTVDVSVSGTGQSDRICTPTLLTPNTSYSIQVAGVSSTGAIGPFSTTITEKTLPPECGFALKGAIIPNHGFVLLDNIGESGSSLHCLTDLPACCRPPYVESALGNWFFPNGTRVPSSGNQWNFHRTRGQMSVLLHRRRGGANGIYRCHVPGRTKSHELFVGVYAANSGDVVVSSVDFQLTSELDATTPTFNLTCISTGGPATTVTWTSNSRTVTDDSSHHIMSQVLTDSENATYNHILMVTGRLAGVYECIVSNNKPSISSKMQSVVAVDHPTGLIAERQQDDSGGFRVLWTPPAFSANLTGYRIYYSGANDSGSVDVDPLATNVTIGDRIIGVTYNITMVALSPHLPSPVIGPVTVTPGMSDVRFSLNGKTYQNNSLVTLEDIGEDDNALFCITDLTACCSCPYTDEMEPDIGNWFFPNGTRINTRGEGTDWDFYRTRGQMVVLMQRRGGGEDGIYSCEIPDAMYVTQTIYIGVYSASTGSPSGISLTFNPKSNTLTCISTGGPATTVTWSRDGVEITPNATYQQTKSLVYPDKGTYQTVLTIDTSVGQQGIVGTYNCTVENVRGKNSKALVVTGDDKN